jgi:hypothetical protein
MGAAVFLFLLHFYLSWITWYQRPETLASTFTLAGTLVLASARFPNSGPAVKGVRAAGILLLATMQAFIRADVAFAAHLGLALACLVSPGVGFALGRKLQAITSVLGAITAAGIQFYLMHVVYPHATYGKSPVLEIGQNLTNPIGIVAFVLFMIPWAWLVSATVRVRALDDGASVGLLLGSAVYLVMWFTVGRIEEVRIFLPYAVALIPFTTECAMRRFGNGSNSRIGKVQMVNSDIS